MLFVILIDQHWCVHLVSWFPGIVSIRDIPSILGDIAVRDYGLDNGD
jgi:hypothetical protein